MTIKNINEIIEVSNGSFFLQQTIAEYDEDGVIIDSEFNHIVGYFCDGGESASPLEGCEAGQTFLNIDIDELLTNPSGVEIL